MKDCHVLEDFVIARIPDPDTRLPHVVRIPIGAEEWTYRFLAAGLAQLTLEATADVVDLPPAGPQAYAEPTVAQVRAWAVGHGLPVSDRGRLWEAHRAAHPV